MREKSGSKDIARSNRNNHWMEKTKGRWKAISGREIIPRSLDRWKKRGGREPCLWSWSCEESEYTDRMQHRLIKKRAGESSQADRTFRTIQCTKEERWINRCERELSKLPCIVSKQRARV